VHADRLARATASLSAAAADALIVTHAANLFYLTGLRASAGALVISPGRAELVVDSRYLTAAQAAAAALPGVRVHHAERALDETVASLVRAAGARRVGIEAAHLPVARFNRLSEWLADSSAGEPTALIATERIVERLRAVKDASEITILREAGRRIAGVAAGLPNLAAPGRTEREVAAAIDASLREAGFERPAFETIVASGPNSALPHARPTGRVLADGDGVVLDFGGIYDGYCVDLTRTLHVGPVSDAFRRLFEAVEAAHAAAIGAVKSGVRAVDIDGAARRALTERGLGEAFGHGTGHGLGLEVHEEPRISPLAPADDEVTAGMVFTIEPGAYVPGVGGVRIEDDVLVTGDGCEILTKTET
jgi:Xaa-Pro aminopeptidase